MAFVITNIVSKNCIRSLEDKFRALTVVQVLPQKRDKYRMLKPKLRNPTWFIKKERSKNDETITPENKAFLSEVVQDRYIDNESSLKETITNLDWKPELQRTGLITRKIGIYPMWLKDGKRIFTTLLQVLDNHVISYQPPDTYTSSRQRIERVYNPKGCILLGAESADPTSFTKEYCGLFKKSGVIPKRLLGRFFVSPDASLPLGTLLNACHFQVGNYVDIRGKTIDRGFQGVMKRHGFKGMPASHGVTKTHRRGGNIGGGGEKGRVWPGTKMPGWMGNRYRFLRGLKIWRINTKYNVLFVSGQNLPGETNSIIHVYDTKLPLKKPTKPLPFPTYIDPLEELPEDIYDDEVHKFDDPNISFNE